MIWYTSDNHFWHKNIIGLCGRPFSSIEEMNEVMVERWNARVGPGDIVIHVGDVVLGKPEESLQIVERLNGEKWLIPGNHDRPWPGHKKVRPRDIAMYTDVGFTILPSQHLQIVGKQLALVCHLPYTGDSHFNDRYDDRRPLDQGRVLICGHVHEKWKTKVTPKGTLQVNVGVDVWDFAPVSEDELAEII